MFLISFLVIIFVLLCDCYQQSKEMGLNTSSTSTFDSVANELLLAIRDTKRSELIPRVIRGPTGLKGLDGPNGTGQGTITSVVSGDTTNIIVTQPSTNTFQVGLQPDLTIESITPTGNPLVTTPNSINTNQVASMDMPWIGNWGGTNTYGIYMSRIGNMVTLTFEPITGPLTTIVNNGVIVSAEPIPEAFRLGSGTSDLWRTGVPVSDDAIDGELLTGTIHIDSNGFIEFYYNQTTITNGGFPDTGAFGGVVQSYSITYLT